MVKKIFALMLVLVMAVSCCAFAEEAVVGDGTATEIQGDIMLISEETDETPVAEAPVADKAKVVFDVSAPDADGIFTVDITLFNATYKGIISAFSYDKDVVELVNAETGEATEVVTDALTCPTVAKDLETGEEIVDWQSFKGSSMKQDYITVFTILNTKAKYPNSIVSENFQALATAEGLKIAELHCRKISDAPIAFSLVADKGITGGMMVVNSYGMQPCIVEFNYADGVGESTSVEIEKETNTKVSDDSETDEETEKKRIRSRAGGTIFLGIGNYATVSDGTLKWIDKENKEVKPYIKNDRTMIPLRYIAEELNCKVEYVGDTREIVISNSKTKLVFQIDSLTYTNDGLKKTIDVAPEIKQNRTFVPLRAVAEALNCDVQWLNGPRMVVVAPISYPWDNENTIEKKLLSEVQLMMSPLIRDLAYANEQ